MFPTLGDILNYFFGISLPIPINTFGFMMASAILLASWLSSLEFRRLYNEGRLPKVQIPSRDKNKRGTFEWVSPDELTGTMTTMAALYGIIGARLFSILEDPSEFMRHPLETLFSRGGFTFYGGLILAATMICIFLKKKGLSILQMADAIAPSLMFAYGFGRIGCQLAGDGDWGIPANMALKPEWLPDWMWAQTYTGNVIHEVIPPPGVYPTPMYEVVFAMVLFGILWAARKHPFRAGWLTSLYFLLNGIERFFIEKIRVNVRYEIFGYKITQAEIISFCFAVVGVVGLIYFSKFRDAVNPADIPHAAEVKSGRKKRGKPARA